jgi:hypothetical protein
MAASSRYSLTRPQLGGFQPSQEEVNLASSLASADPATAGLLLAGARNRGIGARMNYSLALDQANQYALQESAADRALEMRGQDNDLLRAVAANPGSASLLGGRVADLGLDGDIAQQFTSAELGEQNAKALQANGAGVYSLRQAGFVPNGVDPRGTPDQFSSTNPLAVTLEGMQQGGATARTAMTQAGANSRQASRQAAAGSENYRLSIAAGNAGQRTEQATYNALVREWSGNVGNVGKPLPADVEARFREQAVSAGQAASNNYFGARSRSVAAASGAGTDDSAEPSTQPVTGPVAAARAHAGPEAQPTAAPRTDPTQAISTKQQAIQQRGGQVIGVNRSTGQVMYMLNGKQQVE